MEAPLLKQSSGRLELTRDDGDYLPARGLKSWWRIFCIESLKLWAIGGPIAFQILCQYGMNSVATIFVGHLGDVELSAFSIAVSVVGSFAFGFMDYETVVVGLRRMRERDFGVRSAREKASVHKSTAPYMTSRTSHQPTSDHDLLQQSSSSI